MAEIQRSTSHYLTDRRGSFKIWVFVVTEPRVVITNPRSQHKHLFNLPLNHQRLQRIECMKTSDAGMYRKTKKETKPVIEELNKVSPLITRVWTGLRQEKPWPLAGSRCGGPQGGGPQPDQTPKLRADRPALLSVAAVARSLFVHSEVSPQGRI